ncbi:MAG: GTPase Era [Elusimicrobia bacterium]|nr:GTPase Era [Elusimicrobiota bacterium]
MDQSADIEIKDFRAGFVCVAGLPSCGKSSFINALAGIKLSAVSPKPQTTREHIKAVINGKNYQAVIIDTPGLLTPKNLLEKKMSSEIKRAAFEDADIFCLMAEPNISKIKEKSAFYSSLPKEGKNLLLINKIDVYDEKNISETEKYFNSILKFEKTLKISAKTGENLALVKKEIIQMLPFSPPYYPQEQITDRWERFFAAELIRETIFENYCDEIPYSCAVEITDFEENSVPIKIFADIHVSRETHKPILIGQKGKAVKKLREVSAKKISKFLGSNINLFLTVKVTKNWQENSKFLEKFYER